MTVEGYPNWSRGLDIIVGIFLLIIGAWIFLFTDSVTDLALNIFAIALLFMGGTRIVKGVKLETLPKPLRIINVLFGIIILLLSFIVFYFSTLGQVLLIRIITIGFMLIAIIRLWSGLTRIDIPAWARAAQSIVGLLILGLGILIFIVPIAVFNLLVLIVSVVVLANGAIRIANGATGKIR
ncbi:MAG: DUF308 domain-containing protein [Candidatus Thorarchaeota archaeon]